MLLMVTNRRIVKGEYSDEEMLNKKYDYLYDYNHGAPGKDGFMKSGKEGFKATLLTELKRLKKEENVNTPKVGIYIHGYNNSYQDSIDEIYDLHQRMKLLCKYEPVLIGFSWPSSGIGINYLSDREEVRDSVGAFTRFLLDINNIVIENERECFSTTFCIAHSMGNYLLRKGLEYLSDHLGTPVGRMLFDETIMLAPDLSSKDVEMDGKGKYIADFSRRVHVYYSKHDRVLKASSAKRFGGDRLGRHGVVDYSNLSKNVVILDAEKYANSSIIDGLLDRNGEQISVHSSYRYQQNILLDIIQVISSVDRDLILDRKPHLFDGVSSSNHYYLV
jgi:esterase/lipase superfamily enzyme